MSRAIDDLFDRMAASDAREAAKTIPIEVYEDLFTALPLSERAELLDKACVLLHHRITDCTNVLCEEAPERVHEKAFNDRVRYMQQLRKSRLWHTWYLSL